MDSRELLFIACLGLFGGLTSTTTTTTFVSAMSTVNSDIERFLRLTNVSQTRPTVEERIAVDTYVLAYLNYTYKDKNGELIEFAEEKGRYGEGRVLNVNGPLVHVTSASNADDDTACSENILGTLRKAIPTTKWIALVRRGGCTFEEKVRHVWQKGAAGVIIYNDKAVPNLEKMQITDKTRNITAVITYQYIGQEMARSVDEGYEVIASITEGRSGMRPINTLNKTSVLFVSISFIIMMIISLVWLIFYYIQRFRYLQTKDQQSRHLCTVTKRAIMKIPTKTGVRCDEKDADNDCCPICIEAYKSTDCIRVLPCKHEFHKICIDPWLLEHRTCPMCKLDVLKFYGYVVGEQSITISPTSNPTPALPPNDQIPVNTPALSYNALSASPADGISSSRIVHSIQNRNNNYSSNHYTSSNCNNCDISNSCSSNNNNNINNNNDNSSSGSGSTNTSSSSSSNCSSTIASSHLTNVVVVVPNSHNQSETNNSSSTITGSYTGSHQVTDV